MSMRIICPEGHIVEIAPGKLGATIVCPNCLASFPAVVIDSPARQARKEEGKGRKTRDDEDDDAEEEDRPQKKAKAKNSKDDDEVIDLDDDAIQADDKPRIKKSPPKKDDDEVIDLDDDAIQADDKPRIKKSPPKKDDDEVVDLGDDAIQADDKPRIKKSVPKKSDEVVDLDETAIQADDKPRIKKRVPKKDDEDEKEENEDEKPRGKKRARKDDEDEKEENEDEMPRGKKRARKDDEDEEDEEEKDDDEEAEPGAPPEDEEEPIVWTPRKRQMKIVSNAMMFYQITFWIMFALYILDVLGGLCQMVALFGVGFFEVIVFVLFAFILLPAVGVTYICLLVAWIMCFWAPSRAELRSSIITSILFLMLPVLFLLTFLILSLMQVFRNDDITSRFGVLIMLGCGLSLLVSFFFGLEIVRRLAFFMKNASLSNQPITLGWFIIGGTVLRFLTAIAFLIMLRMYAGIPLGLFTIALLGIPIYCGWALFFFVLRSILELIAVIGKLRAEIDKYIKYG